MCSQLQNQAKRLQDRLDHAYIDKLDGVLASDRYQALSVQWRNELEETLRKLDSLNQADSSYMEIGAKLIELAQTCVTKYESQSMSEKRRLLNFVTSNSTWKDGRLTPTYRKPFDLIAISNTAYKKSRAVSGAGIAENKLWLGD